MMVSVLLIILGACMAWIVDQYHRQSVEAKRLWQLVEDLRADNKALMESLCRAEGKPFISESRTTIPSEGWWDAKPEVVVKDVE